MKNITMSSTTPIPGVGFAFPQAAGLDTRDRGELYGPTHKATAVKDVAYLRSRRPPV